MVWSGRFRVSLASTGTHQARWLLLRNPENLRRPEQRIHLQDLLNANRKLMTVYLRGPAQDAMDGRRRLAVANDLAAMAQAPQKPRSPH